MNEPIGNKQKGNLFVVSGPSGSGKTTLCRAAVERTNAHLSVSATTRPQSAKEIEGKDYYFLTKQDFLSKVEKGEFMEYAQVFDNYYGTPTEPVLRQLEQGQPVVLEIDVQGATQVFAKFPEAVGILVLPPEPEELRRRLCGRGRDDQKVIEGRLAKSQKEIDQARAGGHYKHTIVNDDLNRAIEALVGFIRDN